MLFRGNRFVIFGGDDFIMVDTEQDDELGLFPLENIEFSQDTEWFFEGAWYSMCSYLDDLYPSMFIGEPMASQDDDGHLGVWVRLDFQESVMWLRIMTFSPLHWIWKDSEYH
jgi:hypothetical protein|tara:strand:+ start:52 stop:387 length:336 start_codon:yes stop_codon:yes gene_type:complete